MKRVNNLPFLLLAALLSSPSSVWKSAVQAAAAAGDEQEEEDQCGLYLAISSTSTGDRTNWGVYAGKAYEKNSVIGHPELAVNAIHLRANNLFGEDSSVPENVRFSLTLSLELLEESFWVGDPAGGRFELGRGRLISAISGVGFLGSYNSKLTSADWHHKSTYQRRRLGEEPGVPHPGRGAITPFYNVELRSVDNIKPGSEIFVNYGTSWDDKELEGELVKPDFAKIDDTIDQMITFFSKHKEELSIEAKLDIYQFITKDVMTAAVGPNKARKVASMLPPIPDDLANVKKAGGSLIYSQPAVFRSLDWLKDHGRCMDNIRPGASTIPNAGRGAFASRPIKEGGLVTPVPLLHIPNKAVLDTHELELQDNGEFIRKSDDVVGEQLLVNYCFGHRESRMLFYPTGSGAGLINHADQPNAKLVWSKHPSHQRYWLDLTPEELLTPEHFYPGLMIEVVATRDIKEGEEIFINYGKEWKAAWARHVNRWERMVEGGKIPKQWPLRAVDLNEEYRTKVFKTEDELIDEPYPNNVGLGAFLMLESSGAEGTEADPAIWTNPPNGTFFVAENIFEPVIIDRVKLEHAEGYSSMPYNYTVRWTNVKNEHTFVKNVPHDAFVFVEEPETGDQFNENSFRHYIAIPDEIFPKGPWRNAV